MTNKELFNHIVLERECIKNRENCSKDCKNCRLCSNALDRHEALSAILDILRARDPELYFVNILQQLKGLVNDNETQS